LFYLVIAKRTSCDSSNQLSHSHTDFKYQLATSGHSNSLNKSFNWTYSSITCFL